MNQITVAGLSLSLSFLVASLAIFVSFPALKCVRINIHKNMFLSITLNNIAWLAWYKLVLFDSDVWSANPIWCRILHVLTTYFMLTTYFWMLCEGTYLRMILVKTFIEEEIIYRLLMMIGWVIPLFVVIPYIFFRLHHENELCWMDQGYSVIFLAVPAIIVILLNILFLCSVIQVLRKKLLFENSFNQNNNNIALKSARAVMILVPIFGLHFILLPIRPERGSFMEYTYEVVSSLSTSLQGFSVSFLLCFCNSEISLLLSKKIMFLTRMSADLLWMIFPTKKVTRNTFRYILHNT